MKKKSLIITLAVCLVITAGLITALTLRSCGGGESGYDAYFEAAQMYYESGDYDKAEEYANRALALDATDECLELLADIIAAKGEKQGTATPSGVSGADVSIGGWAYAASAEAVTIRNEGLRSSDLKELSKFTGLLALTLSGNDIEDLAEIGQCRKLTFLDLSDNKIKDISPLNSLEALQTLYLDNNDIRDFTPLYALKNLKTLSINGIEMPLGEFEALKAALKDCTVFADKVDATEELELGGIVFRTDVEELDLRGCGITNADLKELAKCTKLRKLELRENEITDITPLAGLKELTYLSLWNNGIVDATPLGRLQKLIYLDIDGNQIEDISALSALTDLEQLWLSNNKLKTIEPLSALVHLERLGLNNAGLKDGDLNILKALKSLEELRIEENTALTKDAVSALKEALPNCTVLAPEFPEETEIGEITGDRTGPGGWDTWNGIEGEVENE